MKVYPVGHKIIVRRIEKEVKKSGIILPGGTERAGNAWGTITELPEVSDNMWIMKMNKGDEVLYKRFQADTAINHENTEEDFEVVDVEPNDGSRAGQVMAIIHKENLAERVREEQAKK